MSADDSKQIARLFKERRFAPGETVTKEGVGRSGVLRDRVGRGDGIGRRAGAATLKRRRLFRRDRPDRRRSRARPRSPPTPSSSATDSRTGSSGRSCNTTQPSPGTSSRPSPSGYARRKRAIGSSGAPGAADASGLPGRLVESAVARTAVCSPTREVAWRGEWTGVRWCSSRTMPATRSWSPKCCSTSLRTSRCTCFTTLQAALDELAARRRLRLVGPGPSGRGRAHRAREAPRARSPTYPSWC